MQIFKARNTDLDVTSESWRKASYKEMEERIPKNLRLPRKAIREVVVPIKKGEHYRRPYEDQCRASKDI